jgi:hypothetical protein
VSSLHVFFHTLLLCRAQAAAAHQQQLLDALSQQAAAAGKQEWHLATQRRQLVAEMAALEQQQRPGLESAQAAAVEAEDFEAAAAIDEQLQVRFLQVSFQSSSDWFFISNHHLVVFYFEKIVSCFKLEFLYIFINLILYLCIYKSIFSQH